MLLIIIMAFWLTCDSSLFVCLYIKHAENRVVEPRYFLGYCCIENFDATFRDFYEWTEKFIGLRS